MGKPLSILVVGAGIGGLSAAIALAQTGPGMTAISRSSAMRIAAS